MTRGHAQRTAVLTAVCCAVLGVCTGPAHAAVTARSASASGQVSSAQWGSVATMATAPPYGAGPLTLTFGATGTQSIVFQVANTGQLALAGVTYTLSGANLPRGGPQITVYACVGGTWDFAVGGCSGGTLTTVMTTGGGAVTTPVSATGLFPAAAGETVQFVGYLSKAPSSTTTATVAVDVTRAQVRPPTVTAT